MQIFTVRRAWIALALLTISTLAYRLMIGRWLISASGLPVLHDFLDLWAAGIRAWRGEAILAYDYHAHSAFQRRLVGDTGLPYPYPPHFFFFLLPFAPLPYLWAMVSFLLVSAAAYAGALWLVVKDLRTAIPMALAMGGGYFAFLIGQIGFLTGAFLVGGLALLPRHPYLAGILFGCLTIKPHLGIVLAAALFLGKEWRAIWAASGTTLTLALAAEVAFGPGIWTAYLPAAQFQSAIMWDGSVWQHGGSVYSVAFFFLGNVRAMGLHLVSASLAAALFGLIWYRKPAYEVRAAALIATTLLVSPYLFPYDAVVLTGAAAFLLKDSKHTLEKVLIILACALPCARWYISGAAVPMAAWLMLYLAARRETERSSPAPVMPSDGLSTVPPQRFGREVGDVLSTAA